MDKQKFYVNIFMNIFIGILFFVSLGFLIYCIAVQNKIYSYILLVNTVVMSFLTSYFITQAVKYHRESRKDANNNSER